MEDQLATASKGPPYYRWSIYCAIALYLSSALWGVFQIIFPDNGALYLLFTLLFALSATSWARYDSMARGKPILPVLQMLYFFLWPIGAPLYLTFRSGWRGILTAAMHGIAMLVLMGSTFYATFYGLHFAGLLDARYYQQP